MKQGSDEWFSARRCRITASRMGDVLANPNTKRYRNYQEDIIDEIMGVPDFRDTDQPWFQHGKDWEPEARGLYEWETGFEVEEVGVEVHPDYDFISCSPDGEISKDGGLEIKSHKSLVEHKKSIRVGIPSKHKPQVQSSLWITGRKWWDFVSFYKNTSIGKRDIYIYRVTPDSKYIKRIEKACLKFWDEIKEELNEIRS